MEWERDERNEPVPAWSCNPVSTWCKPRWASHIQLRNWVHRGIVSILYVCSKYISRWCNIEVYGGCLALFSHLERCFLTQASKQQGDDQSQWPTNGTSKEAKGRRRNKCWNLYAVQEVAQNECLAGLYQPQDRCFQWVGCRLQLSKNPLDVSLVQTDSFIWSLAKVFCWETWASTSNKPQWRLEPLQSQSQLPATSNHISASNSLFQNQKVQSPSPRSALGEQHSHLQGIPFWWQSGCHSEIPVICEDWIQVTAKLPWWKSSWRYDQRLQSITWQYTRCNLPRGNIQQHAVVHQSQES